MHNNLPPVRVIATLVPSPRVDPFGDPAGAPGSWEGTPAVVAWAAR